MNYPDIDLNDLAAFDTIRRTGSVSQAAIELGVAQPTLSNRLRRMRERLDDPLFIRSAEGMLPTPYAESIGVQVADALAALASGIRNRGTFDPARETRRFTILMTVNSEMLLLCASLKKK